jgi:hypothetical protein
MVIDERPEGFAAPIRDQGHDLEGLCLLEEHHDRSNTLIFTTYPTQHRGGTGDIELLEERLSRLAERI